ncbi:hypothetical protein BGZ67_000053 [Mortierella alpina]|nr:hypothetical protein BGZ67_000053 [Mortierella alpina]
MPRNLLQEYLESPVVIWRDQDNIDFTASILVFTTMTQETAGSDGTASDPPSTFQVVCQQYESIKEQYSKIKAQKRMSSSGKR